MNITQEIQRFHDIHSLEVEINKWLPIPGHKLHVLRLLRGPNHSWIKEKYPSVDFFSVDFDSIYMETNGVYGIPRLLDYGIGYYITSIPQTLLDEAKKIPNYRISFPEEIENFNAQLQRRFGPDFIECGGMRMKYMDVLYRQQKKEPARQSLESCFFELKDTVIDFKLEGKRRSSGPSTREGLPAEGSFNIEGRDIRRKRYK